MKKSITSFHESMVLRIYLAIISGIFLFFCAFAYSRLINESSNFRIGLIVCSGVCGLLFLKQIFHIVKLIKLKKQGVDYCYDNGDEIDEDSEDAKLIDDYQYGENGEDFEFLLKDGEYTYDTSEDVFCPKCGDKREPDWLQCPMCGQSFVEEAEEKEYCHNCGAEKSEEFDYCPKCGHRFDDENFNE